MHDILLAESLVAFSMQFNSVNVHALADRFIENMTRWKVIKCICEICKITESENQRRYWVEQT